MALTVRSDAGGTFGAVQFNAEDILRIEATKTKAAPGKLLEATSADQATVALAGPSGTPFGFRNKIINGDMRVWQRGASANGNSQFAVDRWMLETSIPASAGVNLTQYADASISATGPYHLALQTTAIGTVGASNYAMVTQRIEGLNVQDLKFGTAAAKTITLSFRANSNQPSAVMSVALRGAGYTRSYVTTVALTMTPTNYTIIIPGDTTGAWVTDNGVGLAVHFSHSVGTTLQTPTLNAWQAGSFVGASTQTQMFQIASAAFNLSDVQLEVGNVATPFEKRNVSLELTACQRYYEKGGGTDTLGFSGNITSALNYYAGSSFKVAKRTATPTMSYIAGSISAGFPAGVPSSNSVNENGFSVYKTANAASNGAFYFFGWTADAEL